MKNKPKYIVQLKDVGDFIMIEAPDGFYRLELKEIMIKYSNEPARYEKKLVLKYEKKLVLKKVEDGKHNNPLQKDS